MSTREVPASVGQRLLWLLSHYRATAGALNCPTVFRLRGPLDRGALQTALDELAIRHESLRTTFRGRGANLVQLIHDPAPVPIADLSVSGDEMAVQRVLAEELRRPIDPMVAPLRVTIWRCDDGSHVLCVNLHHLVTDAWSCGIVFRDLCMLYDAAMGGKPALPQLGWQYAQFAASQRRTLAGDALRAQQGYWRNQLAGARVPELPLRDAGPEDAARRAVVERARIEPDIVDELKRLARSQRTTLFSVLLSAYYALIHARTGESQPAVASLFANRGRNEAVETVGFLVNMLLLHTKVPASGTFRDLLRATHDTVLGAFSHQELPFQMVSVQTVKDRSMRVDEFVFQMLVEPVMRMSVGGLEAEFLVPDDVVSRFDVELTVLPAGGALVPLLLFAEGRLDRTWAASFVADYATVIDAVVRRPDRRLSQVLG